MTIFTNIFICSGSIEDVPYLHVPPSFLSILTQYAYKTMGYFRKINIGVEDMEFPGVKKVKICGIFRNELENGSNSHG